MTKNKVFILEPVRQSLDVSKAEAYGEIIYIFRSESRRCSVWDHQSFSAAVLSELKILKFNPKTDFICIVGAMLTVTIAVIAITQRYKEFNALLFNSVSSNYVHRKFVRKEIEHEIENSTTTVSA